MPDLFFANIWATLSTIFLCLSLLYILYSILRHRKIEFWGKRILTLTVLGLLLCIFVVMRDDYVAAMQGGVGLFPLQSPQITLAYAGAAIVGLCGLSSVLIHSQRYRKAIFFLLSAAIVFKAVLIEVSRILIA